MAYKVKVLYYTYREVVITNANDEEEAQILAEAQALDDSDYIELGKNAIMEGSEVEEV